MAVADEGAAAAVAVAAAAAADSAAACGAIRRGPKPSGVGCYTDWDRHSSTLLLCFSRSVLGCMQLKLSQANRLRHSELVICYLLTL